MSLHWWHVLISWALATCGFGAMALLAWRRLAVARRRLALLDPRERRPR